MPFASILQGKKKKLKIQTAQCSGPKNSLVIHGSSLTNYVCSSKILQKKKKALLGHFHFHECTTTK